MRPIELTLSLLTIVSALLLFFPKISTKLKFQAAPLVLIITAAAQLVFEGFRWQLWPLMIAVGLLLLTAVTRLAGFRGQSKLTISAIGVVLLAILSLAGGWLLPIPKPYPVTGTYQVGTMIFPLTDESRKEIYSEDLNTRREIMVRVWYPASPTAQDQRAQWMPNIASAGPAIAEWVNLPSFAFNHLKYAKTNAWLDAPVAPEGGKFPLLVFSHGWSGFKEQNIYQVEELASHGYVVAGIDHTYGAVLTVFPDGEEMPRNDAALPGGVSEEEYARASNRLVKQWADDIGFVLDEFAKQDQDGDWPLAGRLDFNRVGVFGHSTGGGATAEFCGIDRRCDAALMMDLWVEPVSDEVVTAGLTQPSLLMHSAGWVDLENPSINFLRIGELAAASSGEVTEFRIEGTEHYDFTSVPLFTPLAAAIGLKGPIPGDSGLALINYYSAAFFNQYLRGEDQGLLEAENSPFEAAQFGLRP
ncbi:MAG: hypothetical protein JW757_04545 [Anaerolineales bacterium]|nr:hypothetical protein [Anaerolineales bacterium]